MPSPTVLQVAEAAMKVYNERSFDSHIDGFGRPQARFFNEEEEPQICIWMNDDNVILSFRGTVHTKDWTENNSKFGINSFPARFPMSYEWGEKAKMLAGTRRRVIITGHSLGGGLAQLVGYYLDELFFTFNAPPVRNLITNKVIKTNKALKGPSEDTRAFAKGFNFRVSHDPVSHLPGRHIGSIIELAPSNFFQKPHIGANVISAIKRTSYATRPCYVLAQAPAGR